MTGRRKAWVSWSTGKDSCFALASAREDEGLEVAGLLSTMNAEVDRVPMHAVRRELVIAQANRLGLPLHIVDLPSPCPHDEYAALMRSALSAAEAMGVTDVVFGDLFLEDVREYREKAMAESGVTPAFPLWGRPTRLLAEEIIAAGVKAIVTCVDLAQLSGGFVGRSFDDRFLADLPSDVDPCGENGEFHTFVWDGPVFSSPIPTSTGTIVERDGFAFCDVLCA